MKARIPHPFYQYASNFSLKSMLKAISWLSKDIFMNPSNELGLFAGYRSYTITLNGKKISGKPMLLQTWLIDLMYDLIKFNPNGSKEISLDEALHLIALHNDYANCREKDKINKNNVFLHVYGFFGEQKKFQAPAVFFDDFAREKYILDTISLKEHPKNTFGLNIPELFYSETGFQTNEYSAIMFLLFAYCSNYKTAFKIDNLKLDFKNPLFSIENIEKIILNNSITVENIIQSPLQRQVLYTKPLIKVDDEFISSNPFLLLSAFVNSNFWVIRNYFCDKKEQTFTNAFGKYFEIYLEEVFENCLGNENYSNIPESDKEKRADWHLKIDGYDILIEQKSAISILSIKQNRPDIEAMKTHILRTWGKAVRQLDKTEKALGLNNAIKIILVYEDYFKSECLDELFELDSSLNNDGNYWLVPIKELEMLLVTYKNNPELFFKIMKEKISSERTFSSNGRELLKFLEQNGITKNEYLKEFGISDYFEKIKRTYMF